MARPKRNKIKKGTRGNDVLTGTKKNDRIKGLAGDDIIESGAGKDRGWGGKGKDRFITEGFAKGHMKIMDMEAGEVIEFCGCPSTKLKQRGKNVWITLGSDIKAVVKNADMNLFDVDFGAATITMLADSPS